MMSMLCNCCVLELLILARTWFAFGLPSKTGCDKLCGGPCGKFGSHLIEKRSSLGPRDRLREGKG
jgi:hypothetical protein